MWHLLNTRRRVWRRVLSDDGMGGRVTTWSPEGVVRCRIAQPRAVERVLAQQAGSRHDHYVWVGPGTDVRRGDRLCELDADPDDRARPYLDVESVLTPSEPVYLRAECRLIQPEGVA